MPDNHTRPHPDRGRDGSSQICFTLIVQLSSRKREVGWQRCPHITPPRPKIGPGIGTFTMTTTIARVGYASSPNTGDRGLEANRVALNARDSICRYP
jgi:hypothetical protein